MNEMQAEFVEQMGRLWESFGSTRSAGRVIGWLMICDPPHQSSQQLSDELQLSPASISTTTRQLMGIGMVRRVTFPGDRASYFELVDHVWPKTMETRMDGLKALMAVVPAAEALTPRERPERVTELGPLLEFLFEEWPALLERFRKNMERER